MLSAIAHINHCIDTGSAEATMEALSVDTACIENLDEENGERYQKALAEAKATKLGVSGLNIEVSK